MERELDLDTLRERIDELDKELIRALNARAEVSLDVGRWKARRHEPIFAPFREQEVMNRLAHGNPGPLPEKHLRAIYREIMSSSRRLQRPERTVYLGPEGTFSHIAALTHMGHSQHLTPKENFEDIFRAVADEGAELGVVPLENSLEGTVGQVVDLFMKYPVYIQSELYIRISHSLMSKADGLQAIREVHSHPQPLEQCRDWLTAHLRGVPRLTADSTAAAAELAAAREDIAVVGHEQLAELHGLNILAARIEDHPDNWTRFLVIGPSPVREEKRDKTSILFTLPDRPGSLAGVLNTLAGEGINMTKLESRPFRGEKWKYVFFTDLECDLGKTEYESMLANLREQCHTLRVLGTYPAAPKGQEG
ncbi:prephenate dehydratase [Salidesulfovibrio brasiliensis]